MISDAQTEFVQALIDQAAEVQRDNKRLHERLDRLEGFQKLPDGVEVVTRWGSNNSERYMYLEATWETKGSTAYSRDEAAYLDRNRSYESAEQVGKELVALQGIGLEASAAGPCTRPRLFVKSCSGKLCMLISFSSEEVTAADVAEACQKAFQRVVQVAPKTRLMELQYFPFVLQQANYDYLHRFTVSAAGDCVDEVEYSDEEWAWISISGDIYGSDVQRLRSLVMREMNKLHGGPDAPF
jgi:hypothetical protein